MKHLRYYISILLLTASGYCSNAQREAILAAPPADRLPVFWHYCAQHLISDRDSITTHRFLSNIIRGADSLGDEQLKAYAQYFQKCWRILFSEQYELHFPAGYPLAIDLLYKTQGWALRNKYADIAASCEHYIGYIYYRANRYGPAFEHLLKADDAFKKIGYQHVPNVSEYLYMLGLSFYRFEEYDKALQKFLEGANYPFYMLREELNTLNAIGLIYARRNAPEKAISFFRSTIEKAKQNNDRSWIGIAAGNLGNVYLAAYKDDSALFYHRINFRINSDTAMRAAEDAAKTALSIATVFVRKAVFDSMLFYMQIGKAMAALYIKDSTEYLDFDKRLLNVRITYSKSKGNLREALLLTDSLMLVEQKLRSTLDSKILSRAEEKAESVSYNNKLALLQSQKDLAQLRSYIVIALLLLLFVGAGAVFRDKWLRRKRQMLLAEKDKQILVAEKMLAEEGLNHSKELLQAYIDTIKEKTQLIEHLEGEILELKKFTVNVPELKNLTSNREKLMASTILTDKDWQQFRDLFEQVHPGFSYQLKISYPDLSPAEARFMFLAKLHLSSREMATMLGISVDSMYKLRYRLRKKLNLVEDSGFEAVLRKIEKPAIGKAI